MISDILEEMSLSEDDLNGISDNADEKNDEEFYEDNKHTNIIDNEYKDQYLESRDSAEMEILNKLNKVEIDDYSTLKNEKHLNGICLLNKNAIKFYNRNLRLYLTN